MEDNANDKNDAAMGIKPSFAKGFAKAIEAVAAASSASASDAATPTGPPGKLLIAGADKVVASSDSNSPPPLPMTTPFDSGLEICSPIHDVLNGVITLVGNLSMTFLGAKSPEFVDVKGHDRFNLMALHKWLSNPENMKKVQHRGAFKKELLKIKHASDLPTDFACALWVAHYKKEPKAQAIIINAQSLLVYKGDVRQRTWYMHQKYSCDLTFEANIILARMPDDTMMNITLAVGEFGKTAASFVAGSRVAPVENPDPKPARSLEQE